MDLNMAGTTPKLLQPSVSYPSPRKVTAKLLPQSAACEGMV